MSLSSRLDSCSQKAPIYSCKSPLRCLFLYSGWQHIGHKTERLLKARKGTILPNKSLNCGFFTYNFHFLKSVDMVSSFFPQYLCNLKKKVCRLKVLGFTPMYFFLKCKSVFVAKTYLHAAGFSSLNF